MGKPLRMCVVDVFKGMGSGFSVSGIIHAGAVQPGDRLLVMPQGEMLTVKGGVLYQLARCNQSLVCKLRNPAMFVSPSLWVQSIIYCLTMYRYSACLCCLQFVAYESLLKINNILSCL